jgi:hypothetical protein
MDDSDNDMSAPTSWLEALAASEAQLKAGLVVPAEAVRERLLESMVRLQATYARVQWFGQ